MDLRIVVGIKCRFRNIKITADRAVAQRGVATGQIHIQRAAGIADNGVSMAGKHIQRIFLIGIRHRDHRAQHLITNSGTVQQTLVFRFRHSAAQKIGLADPLGQRMDLEYHILLCVPTPDIGIQCHGAFRIHDALHLPDGFHIRLIPAVGAEQAQIKHILFIGILLSRSNHIRLGDPKTHKNGAAKGDDRHDRQIPSQRFDNGPAQIPAHHISPHYHSISATSTGFSFFA